MVIYQSILRPLFCSACLLILISGCAASSGSKINQVLQHPDYRRAGFSNVLVIAVAADYNARAQFERQVVAGIRETGAAATAYYTVIGHNPPVTSSDINNAVRARNFDAVLMTRIEGQDSQVAVKGSAPDAQAKRRDGNVIDLFRYDYEEFNEPERVEINSSIVLVTEMYAAVEQKKVWAIESTSFNYSDIYHLINSEVETIVGRLKKDGMISQP
jgi:hypothetical protein